MFSLTHYHRTSDRFAFSTGGFYEHTGGFFENSARNNEKVDKSNAGGGSISWNLPAYFEPEK